MRLPAYARCCVLVGGVLLGAALPAWANVYPSAVTVDTTAFSTVGGTVKVSYVLNENADGDGVNPGVKIEVIMNDPPNPASVVRTVTYARQVKGTYIFQWDGRKDDGSMADFSGSKTYSFRITASDNGYTLWTRISDETSDNLLHFERPRGVSVNTNPGSPNYGKIYVSQASNLATGSGRAQQDGIYMLKADGSDAGFSNGGVDWTTGDTSYNAPLKSMIGPDDHLYVTNYNKDLAFEFSADMTTATQLIDASNKTTGQYVYSMWVTGTQAGGDRAIYTVDADYYGGALGRKGLIRYILGSNAKATANDTGTQYIGPNVFKFYPRDVARDSQGNWYLNEYRANVGQAPIIQKFADSANLPINTSTWKASDAFTYALGIALYEPKNWIAYGRDLNGSVYIFNMLDGSFITSFVSGVNASATPSGNINDLAFDAAGNLYTVCNVRERLRVWSPPDGPNHKDYLTSALSLSKTDTGGPSITDQPDSLTVCVGSSAGFSVAATGAAPLSYQWQKNGVNLVDGTGVAGATTASLTLNPVAAADNGALVTCKVSDANGMRLSDAAVLTASVSFIDVPITQWVCAGGSATFRVNATGLGALSYQWQRSGAGNSTFADIAGETNPSITVTGLTTAMSNVQYRCNVTDAGCGTTAVSSSAAYLFVTSGPLIGSAGISYVSSSPVLPGGSVVFVCNMNRQTGSLTYQWKRGGVALVDGPSPYGVVSGAQTSSLVLTEIPCGAGANFTVTVTDACGSVTSGNIAVAVGKTEAADLVSGSPACSNGIDDDCDGSVDCADSDCAADANCKPPCPQPFADRDSDGDVDMLDFADLQRCYAIAPAAYPAVCECLDYNNDGHIDLNDVSMFVACGSGPGIQANPDCDNRPSGDGKVVINELAYDMTDLAGTEIADQFEFVELFNRSTETVDISGWILRASDVAPPTDDNRDFMIPGGVGSGTTVLAPGGFYVFTSPNVSVPAANPPYLNFMTVPNPTDIWENGPDTLELLDGNRQPVDTVIYARNKGTVSVTGEGSIWGNMTTVDSAAKLSAARYYDGFDTNSNGRDFGLRPWTPGTSNQTAAATVATYKLPSVDALATGTVVSGLEFSYRPVLVIDPADAATQVDGAVINPNVIPASPQGGKAALIWDYVAGGGNAAVSRNLMNNAGGFDLWVYLDTSFTGWGTDTGWETTSYGAMGTTDTMYATPDPDGTMTTAATTNGNTGLCWVFNKYKAGATGGTCKLFLCDAGAGGDSRPVAAIWSVKQTIDLTGQPSGWYRLSIAYDGATGNVNAVFANQAFNFTTTTGLAGEFYVGYREAVAGTAYLRPATFDTVP